MITAHIIKRELEAALVEEPKPPAKIDARARAVITLHTSAHLLSLINPERSTFQILNDIKAHFAGKNLVRLVQLRREFSTIKKKPDESISEYHDRIVTLRDKLHLAGHKVEDPEVTLMLLAGLPEPYNMVIEALGQQTLPLSEVITRLKATEARLISQKPAQREHGHA